jgi:hypothetical protein
LFVIVPGTALDGFYGLSNARRAAAVANNSRSGWWLASITRTRRVLRRIFARYVVDHHVGAGVAERERNRSAYAGTRPGDHRLLPH